MESRARPAAAVSSFQTPLILEYGDGHEWRLVQGFRYDTDLVPLGAVYVPAGFETDFASIPRPLWNILPPTGAYGKAAVVHDWCYRKSGISRELADKILLEAMETLGVSWLTRHLIYRAVRVFGGSAYQPKVFA